MDWKTIQLRAIRRAIVSISDLAYDSVTKILYWSQGKYGAIGAMERSGRRIAILRRFDDVLPYRIVVHIRKRILFYVVMDLAASRYSATKIMKSDLDGRNPTPVVNYPNALLVFGITIDYETDRLFWTDFSLISSANGVFSSDLDGSDRREIFAIKRPGAHLWGVGVVNGYVYAANIHNNTPGEYFIHMSRTTGGNVTDLKLKLQPRFLTVYSPSEPQASLVPNECRDNQCEHICLASFNGSSSCTCSSGYVLTDGYKCKAPSIDDNYLLVADLGQMGVFKLPLQVNATNVKAFAVPTEEITTERIFAFAVDPKNGDLIFFKEDFKENSIVWGGKSLPFRPSVAVVSAIAAHCCDDIIFWTTGENIYSWDGKTQDYKTLNYTFDFFIYQGIMDITIDCITNQLYWTEYSVLLEKGSLKRSDLNGNNVEIVLDNLPLTKALTIDYQTHTLHAAGILRHTLYSVPLPQTIIQNTSIYYELNNMTDFSSALQSEQSPTIRDIRVVDGEVYLCGGQRIYRFRLGDTPILSERYGPDIFYSVPNVEFYNTSYYETYMKPACTKPTTPTPTSSNPGCKNLLAKALSSSEGYVSALHVYIKCVIRSLLPDLLSGDRGNIGFAPPALPLVN